MARTRLTIQVLTALMAVSGAACGDDAADTSVAGSGGGAGRESESGSGGGGSGGGGSGGAGGSGTAGTPTTGDVDLYGNFNVTLVPAFEETMTPAMTSVFGKVDDGPTPSPSVWSERAAADGCKLLVPAPVLCDPACGSSAVCVRENTCTPYPKSTSVGTVTLTGLGTAPLSMDVVAGNYQPKAGTSLPYPPCAEGATVALAADGGAHDRFEISASCIAPLVFPGPAKYQAGQPMRLTWTAPAQASLGTIDVEVDLSHHGGTKGKIECEVADSGALEIPATLMDALVELGVAGFPVVSLTRKSTANGSGNARNVALNVVSSQERPVEIPGLRSCSEDTDCETGQTCQADRSCK